MIACDSRYCGSPTCERPECVGELAARRLPRAVVRRRLTGAQILAVAGTISAVIGTVGGALRSPLVIGLASFVMLIGNISAFLAERNRPH